MVKDELKDKEEVDPKKFLKERIEEILKSIQQVERNIGIAQQQLNNLQTTRLSLIGGHAELKNMLDAMTPKKEKKKPEEKPDEHSK